MDKNCNKRIAQPVNVMNAFGKSSYVYSNEYTFRLSSTRGTCREEEQCTDLVAKPEDKRQLPKPNIKIT